MHGATPPGTLLLDTCAVIWLANGDPLAISAADAIGQAEQGNGILISPISAWEIGFLSRPRGSRRLALKFLPDPKTWFGQLMSGPGIREAPFNADIAIDASYLPGNMQGDPADRMLVATARHLGVPIVTRDRRIIDYGSAGHLQVIGC